MSYTYVISFKQCHMLEILTTHTLLMCTLLFSPRLLCTPQDGFLFPVPHKFDGIKPSTVLYCSLQVPYMVAFTNTHTLTHTHTHTHTHAHAHAHTHTHTHNTDTPMLTMTSPIDFYKPLVLL